MALLAVVLKKRNRRGTESPRKDNVSLKSFFFFLFTLSLGASVIQNRAWAGGDPSDGHSHDHEEEQGTAEIVAVAPNIQLGETSTTAKAGPIRITLITRTSPAVAPVVAPGEVALPPQTAELLQIKTQAVTVAQLPSGIAFTGQIAPDPNGTVRVASVVPGRVTRLSVAQGDTVRQGTSRRCG
jgi:biotin carboxyl carrier protein